MRDEPARRLDRRRPALRRGDAQRAGGVGAGRRGHLPRGERGARAAARAARRALERPRVADLVGRPAAGELVRVQVAEQHHPLRAQPRPDVAVALGHLVQHAARRGQRLAGDRVEVLQPDRDRRRGAARRRAASRSSAAAAAAQRVLLVDAHPGVDRVRDRRRGCASRPARGCARGRPRSARATRASCQRRRERRAGRDRSRRGRPGFTTRGIHGPWPGSSATRPFDLFRRRGLTTMFANPGSTEVPFLTGLPDDLRFVLGLHEGTVVGMASGYAIGRRRAGARPAAHDRRARHGGQRPRDRAREPRAAGRRRRPAGPPAPRLRAVPGRQARRARGRRIPCRSRQPAAAQDVPAAIERAYHSAATRRGPALVIVPMGDWERARRRGARARRGRRPGAVARAAPAPRRSTRSPPSSPPPSAPALVVGAGADDPADLGGARRARREARARPVFQEPFGARAGFPQDHPPTRACSPADRARLRERARALRRGARRRRARPSGRPVSSRGG